jgi:hypothetical protein
MISRGSGARVSKVIRHGSGLADLRPGQPAVIELEAKAGRQRKAVEERRRELVVQTVSVAALRTK